MTYTLAPFSRARRVRNRPPTDTVLLAGVGDVLLDVTRRFLLLHGYEVETANGGVECLRQLRRLADPILVLDFELRWGGADGVVARMREDATLADIPVILTTAPPLTAIGPSWFAAPVIEVLSGSPTPAAVLAALRSDRRSRGDPS
jgi:CheY-like chemotaxis protein